MFWTPEKQYLNDPFEAESELESAIAEVSATLFGPGRIYLDVKKLIGGKGKTKNIPDGYLIDLTSKTQPRLYVVENELASHEPLKHVAVQILEFSLSFETSPFKLKSVLKDALKANPSALQFCETYAANNSFENVDVLLERMIQREDAFNALVIIDELDEELETLLLSRFKFPVEILTLRRFKTKEGQKSSTPSSRTWHRSRVALLAKLVQPLSRLTRQHSTPSSFRRGKKDFRKHSSARTAGTQFGFTPAWFNGSSTSPPMKSRPCRQSPALPR